MTTLVKPPAPSRKEAIRYNAAELIAERGYSGVTVQDIAHAVGITPGAIYKHFASKDAVLDSVLLDMVEAWIEASAVEGLDAKLDAAIALVIAHPGEVATFMRERHRVSSAAVAELADRERTLARSWENDLRTATVGLRPGDVIARQFALEGVFGALARRPEKLGTARAQHLVGSALRGLTSAPPSAAAPEAEPADPRWTGAISRRYEIMHTAIRLFSRRGFDGVSLNDIGVAVGITGPSIYEHFASKAEILRQAYDRSAALVAAGFDAAIAEAASADDALDRLIATYTRVCFTNADLIALTEREARALPPTDRQRVSRHRRDMRETLATVLRAARPGTTNNDASLLAWCAFPIIQRIALRASRRSPSLQPHTVQLVRSFLHAKEQP